jgi:hypothetical protein
VQARAGPRFCGVLDALGPPWLTATVMCHPPPHEKRAHNATTKSRNKMSEEIKQIWLAAVAAGIGGGTVGSLLTIFINHRLAIGRERLLNREKGLAADKNPFIFEIDKLIETTKNCEIPYVIRPRFKNLYEPYLRFRPHLKGKRLAAYEEAWKRLQGTTQKEASGSSLTGSYEKDSEELRQIQGLLISRLAAVREIVQDT